jgi:hypothetical protein
VSDPATAAGELCNAPFRVAEVILAFILAPCIGNPASSGDSELDREAAILLGNARKIKRNLDDFLTDDVRNDIVDLLHNLARNSKQYRRAAVLWVDLVEEVSILMEREYGDHMGPVKLRKVRAAIYYLVKGFLGDQELPLGPILRPIVLEIMVRAAVELIISLVNVSDGRPSLWRDVHVTPERARQLHPIVVGYKGAWIPFITGLESFLTKIVAAFTRFIFQQPRLSGRLKAKVEAILENWAERNALTGTTPIGRATQPIFDAVRWVGTHADQVRSLIHALSLVILEGARLSELNRQQRVEVTAQAMADLFADLGYTGPVFEMLIRLAVEMMADAIEHLYVKRGVLR